MRFTVVWMRAAQNQLATLWTGADPALRRAITAAADSIDKQLAVNPQLLGESRSHGRRILFVRPLYVIFRVNEPDRQVVVLTVRRV